MKAIKTIRRLICPEDVSCMLCAAETGMGNGSGLCDKCKKMLETYEGERDIGGFTLYAAFCYRGAVATLIHGFKYENKRYMALPLIQGLIGIYREKELSPDAIIPVPLHKKRQKQRGYNQSALLAEGLCERTEAPLLENALLRIRDTRQQVGLSEADRKENVRNAFVCQADLTGLHIVLVDDVCTTGATMLSCAQTLKQSGARVTMLCAATLSTVGGR